MYAQVRRYLYKWQACDRWQPRTTPCGLCWLQQWSPLKYALGSGFLGAVFAKHFPSDSLARPVTVWALTQLHYTLGDNHRNLSYLIGYTGSREGRSATRHPKRYPRRPHHRASSCVPASEGTCDEPTSLCNACANPWRLHGALVGGPDATDCWNDDRVNWERNEVALDCACAAHRLAACITARACLVRACPSSSK
jgi:hypothetical protein